MTEHDNDILDTLFSRYGRSADDAEIRLYGFLRRPAALDDVKQIMMYDKSAASLIDDCRRTIEQMTAYRKALQERYNYLASAPTVPVVRLTRRRDSYTNKVFYDLTLFRRYIDTGKETRESNTVYPGTERSKAISDYKAYLKDHPGIIAEMDIKKGKWER